SASPVLRTLYEAAAGQGPLQTGHIARPNGHQLYFEVHGNPSGIPACVVHGGPGAGCYTNHSRFFDLTHYKVVLLDQRGCGRSTPRGCLVDNTTQALIADLEALRLHLGLNRWLLFGGSWGVALSLAYALAHPNRVTAMVLRGVCTMRQREIDWMYGGGASTLKPWAWRRFVDFLEPEERGAPLLGYYARLLSRDAEIRDAAARSWMEWEMSVGFGSRSQALDWDGSQWSYQTFPSAPEARAAPRPAPRPRAGSSPPATPPAPAQRARTPAVRSHDQWAAELLEAGMSYGGDPGMSSSTAQALLECHYSVHGAFLRGLPPPRLSPSPSPPQQLLAPPPRAQPQGRQPRSSVAAAPLASPAAVGKQLRKQPVRHDEPLLSRAHLLRHIPTIAVHGQLDFVCPATTAYELHEAWPELQLRLVPGAGHSMYDPAITHELLEATRILYDVCAAAQGGDSNTV
ncbi:Proline iminopeptidase, partial [Tetrabaena socialis]